MEKVTGRLYSKVNICLCNLIFLRHRKYTVNKVHSAKLTAANLADNVVAVLALLNSYPFVQKALLSKGKSPTVVLYTQQQLADIKRFCCAADRSTTRSVLGIDRTFNLGPCYVTAVVYKCRAVVRNNTRTHLTFVGPMFLHWDWNYSTYVDFLTEPRTSLDGTVSSTEVRLSSSVVIGSDEEKGLMKALWDVFSKSTHLLCMKHLRDNITDYMRNKCGVQQSVRNRLVAKIFDDGGLINADDSVVFTCVSEFGTYEYKESFDEHEEWKKVVISCAATHQQFSGELNSLNVSKRLSERKNDRHAQTNTICACCLSSILH